MPAPTTALSRPILQEDCPGERAVPKDSGRGRPGVPHPPPGPFTTDRSRTIGELTILCLPGSDVPALQAREPTGRRLQAVIPLNGPITLGGPAGPLLALPQGALAVAQGDLRLGHDGGDAATILLLRLPAHVLTGRGLRLHGGLARACPGRSLSLPLGEFAYALLRSVPAPRDTRTSRATERSIVDLLAGALLEAVPPRTDGAALRTLLRERAVRIVERRFADPALRPAGIARELNVSLRHLQRSFEGSGTTLALEIRRARSEYAALLLTTPTGPDCSDLRIALRSGFTSADQLRTAFEGHFGVPTSHCSQRRVAEVLQASA
ncbi:helix-turn-helix domain-containing protein [Arthrobacter sp. L77]|uniref:helix-turn-helix domain-containing protein n=1 Tax=Arthrobacter sp. L77 TaxID=1496689 RepID=UPI0006904155|nr:helix-turn-helix domain-containing protein [Arthrobacter sp. L77]